MHDQSRVLARRQFDTLADHIRLIIIHPHYNHTYVLRDDRLPDPIVYFRPYGHKLKVADIRIQWQAALIDQLADAHDFASLRTVIIDESDRITSNAFDSLVRTVLKEAENCRIIIFGRRIPQIKLDDDLRDVTAFIPHHPDSMMLDYAERRPSSLLEVYALGGGRVYLDGQLIDRWDGSLPRALFFYLVDRGIVRRSEIFQTFWGQMTQREATNVFHVTKRKLNEILGQNLTVYSGGYYRISPDVELHYDVERLAQLTQNSVVAPLDEAMLSLNHALTIYQNPFLCNLTMIWTDERRRQIAHDLSDALIQIGQRQMDVDDFDAALSALLQANRISDQQDDAMRALMRLYLQMGRSQDALNVYRHWRDQMFGINSIVPEESMQAMMAALVTG